MIPPTPAADQRRSPCRGAAAATCRTRRSSRNRRVTAAADAAGEAAAEPAPDEAPKRIGSPSRWSSSTSRAPTRTVDSSTGTSSRCRATARIRSATRCSGGCSMKGWTSTSARSSCRPRWSRVQERQEAGRQAEALSGLHRRQHGDQRRHLVPGPRDARHRRLHRRRRQADADAAAGRRQDPRSKPEEKTDEASKRRHPLQAGDRVRVKEGTFRTSKATWTRSTRPTAA